MSLISFITNKKWTIIIILCLFLNLFIAINIRLQRVSSLEGKYLREHDSYYFYHYAKLILKNDELPKQDMTAWMPSGIPTNEQLTLNSYVIVYLYKFLKLFLPAVTLEQVAIYYPVICFALSLIAFFLLASVLFNSNFALLCTTILAVIPVIAGRTEAGFADRDSLCLLELFLSFYFFVSAQKTTKVRMGLIFSFLSGFFMGVLGLTWQGVGLIAMIIVIFNFVKFISGNYQKKDTWYYLCWYVPMITMITVFTSSFRHFSQPFVILAVVIPSLFLILIAIHFIRPKLNLTLRASPPLPIVIPALVVALTLLCVIIGPKNILGSVKSLGEYLSYPFGSSRLMRTIPELRHPALSDWWNWYGLLFLLFLGGVMLMTKKLASAYDLNWQISLGAVALMLAGVFLTGAYSRQSLTDDRFPIAEWIYLASMLIFIGIITALYIHACWRRKTQTKENITSNDDFLFILVWFLIMLIAMRGARRFALFFTPSAVIVGSYAIVRLFRIIAQKRDVVVDRLVVYLVLCALCWEAFASGKNLLTLIIPSSTSLIQASAAHFRLNLNISFALVVCFIIAGTRWLFRDMKRRRSITLTGWVVVVFLVISLLGGMPKLSQGYMRSYKRSYPGFLPPNRQWREALQWIRNNTPKDAVVAAWWDYGYWINALGERATIIDARVYNPDSIHRLARAVFMAQSADESLKFLKECKATHLLIDPRDVSSIFYPISTIGSDENFDRQTSVPLFMSTDEFITTKNGIMLHFVPRDNRVSRRKLLIDSKSYDLGPWSISDIYVELDAQEIPVSSTVVISAMGEKAYLTAEEVYFKQNKLTSKKRALPGTIVIIPDAYGDNRHAAVYLDEIARKSFIMQLCLFNKASDIFELVHPTYSAEMMAKKYRNFEILVGLEKIKIWRIRYPGNKPTNPQYLGRESLSPK